MAIGSNNVVPPIEVSVQKIKELLLSSRGSIATQKLYEFVLENPYARSLTDSVVKEYVRKVQQSFSVRDIRTATFVFQATLGKIVQRPPQDWFARQSACQWLKAAEQTIQALRARGYDPMEIRFLEASYADAFKGFYGFDKPVLMSQEQARKFGREATRSGTWHQIKSMAARFGQQASQAFKMLVSRVDRQAVSKAGLGSGGALGAAAYAKHAVIATAAKHPVTAAVVAGTVAAGAAHLTGLDKSENPIVAGLGANIFGHLDNLGIWSMRESRFGKFVRGIFNKK